MIRLTSGNLLECNVEALVNTVNCDGFMGKGIALQFKLAFPENYKAYHRACKQAEVQPGKMFIFETQSITTQKYIINFPTKRHWREKSRIEDIKIGLAALVSEIQRYQIRSIAIPPLGCGLGGLKWGVVKPLIEEAMAKLSGVEAYIFEPVGTPDLKYMKVRTEKKLTVARALFIRLIKLYKELDYTLTLLEIQKLAYFLQEAGEPLKLRFEKSFYGPYAHNLNRVLESMESHFIRGFRDNQKPNTPIELIPGAAEEAEAFLLREPDLKNETLDRLNRVSKLIEGFETPYSMELLATVHWAAMSQEPTERTVDKVIKVVHQWNARKKSIFTPEHIQVAWEQLMDQGWINNLVKE